MKAINNFTKVKTSLEEKQVTLVAVSKTQSNEAILERYALGQRIFGENRVQELTQKYEALPEDIQWHQIGHLQTNKVKYIIPFVEMIHSGDSLKLLKKINEEAGKIGRVVEVLLQAKVAQEFSKHGFAPEELLEEKVLSEILSFRNIKIVGLMGMASFVSDKQQVRKEFKELYQLFEKLKEIDIFKGFEYLSMGMSGDYEIALEEGANMVRIGSLLF